MGLDTTHGAWSGSYSSFNEWRTWVASKIGIPLDLMEGYYTSDPNNADMNWIHSSNCTGRGANQFRLILPLRYSAFRPNPLHALLNHSDCNGHLTVTQCKGIAKELGLILKVTERHIISCDQQIENAYETKMYDYTERFMKGCQAAVRKKQRIEFQ